MPFSKADFIDGFIAETAEHLDSVNNSIIELKKAPKNKETLSSLLRELHTIKGTGRMMGYPIVEQLSHGLEDVFKGIREEKYELTDHIIQLTFLTSDCIKHVLDKIKADGDDSIDISVFLETFKKASSGLFFSTDILEAKIEDKNAFADIDIKDENKSLENITSIRVDINRINDIVRSFDNLIIRQFRFKHQLEEFEKRLASDNSKQIRELPKQLKEDMLLTENAIFDTQHQLLNLRMLTLSTVLIPIKKEIESDMMKLGKSIDFDMPETEFMLDKAVLEKLRDILLHLVRNCIDHGIESPEERVANGKKDRGHIAIKAQQVSNHIIISVSDDGRGIQYEKVRKKAIKMYPKMQKQIAAMANKELQQYLFESGFSTAEHPTALSGRGVGLDVVRTDMEKIKGRLRLHSVQNEGTTFELTIPVSLATQQGLFVHCSEIKLMIPSHYIIEIIDTEPKNFTTLQGQSFVSLHQQLVPVYHLSSLIGTPNKKETDSLIILEYLETQIAMVVDSIDQYENVVVNPLPRLLDNMEALQGVVYDENYSIIPILNVPNIMRKLKGLLAYDIKKYQSKNIKKTYTVLVVDDSTTTRQIEQTIFETDGYKVETAVDGIDALDVLRNRHIDAIITDIKMPRMDGLVLLSNIRRMEDYTNTPVIVVSGVYDIETKEEFMQAGAQAFIVKSEFQRGNLLQAVKELLGE